MALESESVLVLFLLVIHSTSVIVSCLIIILHLLTLRDVYSLSMTPLKKHCFQKQLRPYLILKRILD